mmetsp:Transcript_30733/g.57554  ORF Transcript_30733/g.57554 Transcript_30733/m.57554 type:complete len:121 (-) Transcript_30733:67-429(-)
MLTPTAHSLAVMQEPPIAALRLALLRIGQSVGFDYMERAAVDGLSEAARLHLQDMGWRCARCAELAGRSFVAASDVRAATGHAERPSADGKDAQERSAVEEEHEAASEDAPFSLLPRAAV